MGELRLLLADDHVMLRQALKKILANRCEWRVVAEVGNGHEAVSEAIALQPDVAVLDISMPRLNGLDATRQIVRRAPSVRVLILSMHNEQVYVTQALQAGAKGYVLKSSAGAELIEAVSAVATGHTFCSRTIAHLMFDSSELRASLGSSL